MSCIAASRRRGLTGAETLVVIAIIAILIGLLLPAVNRFDGLANSLARSRDPALQVIGVAAHNYHDEILGTEQEIIAVLIAMLRSGQLNTEALAVAKREFSAEKDALDGLLEDMRKALDGASMQDSRLLQQGIAATQQVESALDLVGILIGLLLPAVTPGPDDMPMGVQNLQRPLPATPTQIAASLVVRWQELRFALHSWAEQSARRLTLLTL
jgi:hypothetical protein